MTYRNPEDARIKTSRQRWYYKNREYALAKNAEYRQRVKDGVFAAYGGYICVCCGETETKFLTIDHTANNGSRHRSETGQIGGYGLYNLLHREKYPSGYQVLCFNCNHGKYLNHGICPHKREHQPVI